MALFDKLPLQRRLSLVVPFVLVAFAGSCGPGADTDDESAADDDHDAMTSQLPEGAEALSLLGEPLFPPAPSEEYRLVHEGFLTEAQAALEANAGDADALVWVGRRQAYLGRYHDALATFTDGIRRHPEDARFYRHRGHRHVTIREFEAAVNDFDRAAALIEGTEDVIEPDGLPNAAGIPLSTLQFNIWYHLGLAHYLQGDLEAALGAYERCMEVSVNPDLQTATAHWLYMTLRELGRDVEAAAVLEPFSADMEIVENASYHELLLMYRGELEPEDLLNEDRATDSSSAATLYGVGNWFRYNGDETRAAEVFQRLLDTDQWAAFGFVAAEAAVAGS